MDETGATHSVTEGKTLIVASNQTPPRCLFSWQLSLRQAEVSPWTRRPNS